MPSRPIAVTLALLTLAVRSSAAETYFVRTSGNDAADGRSPAAAFRTVGRGLTALSNAGDELVVGPGTYVEGDLGPRRSGSAGRNLVLAGDPTGTRTGDPAGPVVIEPSETATTGFLLQGTSYIRLSGFHVIGGIDAGIQIRPANDGTATHDVSILDCQVSDAEKRGVDAVVSGALLLERCTIADNGTGGIVIAGGDSVARDIIVRDVASTDNAADGIVLQDIDGAKLERANVTRNGGRGILLRDSANGLVSESVVQTNQGGGLRFDSSATRGGLSENHSIVNSTIERNARFGLEVVGGGLVEARGNRLRDNLGPGLKLTSSLVPLHADLRDNVITANASHGIELEGAADSQLVANQCTLNLGSGMRLEGVSGLTITGNSLDRNSEGGIVVGIEGAPGEDLEIRTNELSANTRTSVDLVARGTLLVENNRIVDSEQVAINLVGLEDTTIRVAANKVSYSGDDGVFVSGGDSAAFHDNQIDHSGGAGIRSIDTGSANALRNVVTDSGERGISLDASGAIVIRENTVDGTKQSNVRATGTSNLATVELTLNRLRNSGVDGASIAGANRVDANDNEIDVCVGSGVSVRDAGTVVLTSNEIRGCRDAAVKVAAVQSVTATENLSEGGGAGLALSAKERAEAAENQIFDAAAAGIVLEAEQANASLSATRNQVRDCATSGISAIGGDEVGFYENTVDRAGDSGLSVANSGDAMVEDNTVRSGDADGILIAGGSLVRVDGNVVSGNDDAGLRVAGTSRSILTGNRSTDNLSTGITVTAIGGNPVSTDVRLNIVERNDRGVLVDGASRGTIAGNAIASNRGDGIALLDCSAVSVLENRVDLSQRNGIAINVDRPVGEGFVLTGNVVTESGDGGIVVRARGDVASSGNRVTGSGSSSVSIETEGRGRASIQANRSGISGAHGLFARGFSKGTVQGNILYSNDDSGMTIRSATRMTVVSNLSYANLVDGYSLGSGGEGVPDTMFTNNTSYGNGGRGLSLGSAANGVSPRTVVINNIFQENGAEGLAVHPASSDGFILGYNIVADGYPIDMRGSLYDLVEPATFVDPDGADGILGGRGALDDDFRLAQRRAGQLADSLGVDRGSASTTRLAIGGTTALGDLPDIDTIDIGFHYASTSTGGLDVPMPFMPIYASATGGSGNDGLSPARPLASIRDAGLKATAGMTVIVAPGRYVEQDPVRVRTASGRVSFYADTTGAFSGVEPGDVIVDANGGDNAFVIVASDDISVEGFHVTGAATAAIQVREGASRAVVGDNVVFSNPGRGIEVRDSDAAEIRNNLVYANGTGGIIVQGSKGSKVLGNTVYGNGEDGILVGGAPVAVGPLRRMVALGASRVEVVIDEPDPNEPLVSPVAVGEHLTIGDDATEYRVIAAAVPRAGELLLDVEPALSIAQSPGTPVRSEIRRAPGSMVARNIIAENGSGLIVNPNAQRDYRCGGNISPDGFAGSTPRCDSDSDALPRFVDPDGVDQFLGSTGYADDDFHLVASGNPAVDVEACGSDGPPPGTTRSDGMPDVCPSDAGYHYPIPN